MCRAVDVVDVGEDQPVRRNNDAGTRALGLPAAPLVEDVDMGRAGVRVRQCSHREQVPSPHIVRYVCVKSKK